MFSDLNYTAIAVITLVLFALGFFWYGPLFGKEWMKLVGLSKKDASGSMAPPIIKGLISTFIMVSIAVYFVELTGASTWQEGAMKGLILGIGLIATTFFGSVNWEQKPVKLYFINTLYYVLAVAIAGGIYVAWPAA